MVHGRFALKFAAFAIAFLLIGTSAWADIVPVSGLAGTVYRVSGNLLNADATLAPGGTNEGVFTDSFGINYNITTAQGSLTPLSTFLGSATGTITASTAYGEVMSNCPNGVLESGTGPTCYSTLVHVTGTADFFNGVTYTLTHDDGATISINGGALFGTPTPTSVIPESWVQSGNALGASIDVWYMGTNGNPEVLQLTESTVPDGGVTLMLLGGALVGLETLRRKFRV